LSILTKSIRVACHTELKRQNEHAGIARAPPPPSGGGGGGENFFFCVCFFFCFFFVFLFFFPPPPTPPPMSWRSIEIGYCNSTYVETLSPDEKFTLPLRSNQRLALIQSPGELIHDHEEFTFYCRPILLPSYRGITAIQFFSS